MSRSRNKKKNMKASEFSIHGILKGREQLSFMQVPFHSREPQTRHPDSLWALGGTGDRNQ